MPKLVFVVNVDWFFISHRLPLARHAIESGYQVYLLSADTGRKTELESMGTHFVEIPFKRSGSNPFHELKCIFLLRKHLRKLKPDVVHNVTLKAALLSSMACKIAGIKNVVNAISGFGYNFTDGRSGLLQKIVKCLIRIAFKSSSFSFILQNPDDAKSIERMGLVGKERIFLIKGSGVNLEDFSFKEAPNGKVLKILFPARILLDKGIKELLEAAHVLKEKYQDRIEFVIAGDCDNENLAVFPEAELRKWLIPGYITWIGFQKEMYAVYADSDIVILPSYREGLPKSLIEACAVGRPLITTDVPGCRECVKPGYNGLLIPAKDSKSIAEAIETLINDPEARARFGKNSRALAERDFSIESVIEKTFAIYHNYF